MDSGKRQSSGEIFAHSKRIHLDEAVDSNLVTTQSTKSEYSFHHLPLELIGRLFLYVPASYWPRLELVDHYFQSGVLEAYRSLKEVCLGRFSDEKENDKKEASERQRILHSLLRILSTRSPNLTYIGEFYAIVSEVGSLAFQALAEFTTLKCVDFLHCRVDVRSLAVFLTSSRSRACLEELYLLSSIVVPAYSSEMKENESMLLEAMMDKPGRPPLRLKTFIYENNNGCSGGFLAGLDGSSLETLEVAGSIFDGHRLAEFLGRCTKLQEFTFGIPYWNGVGDNSIFDITQVPVSVKIAVLDSLGSLACPNLRKLELRGSFPVLGGTIAETFGQMASNCQRLETLDIRNYVGNPSGLLNVIREHLSSLDNLYLDISNCDAASLTQLVTGLKKPKRIGFYCRRHEFPSWPQINSDVLKAIALHARTLTSLYLDGLNGSDDTFRVISELEQLKELSVTGPSITDRAVFWWCQSLGPRLELLTLSCSQISDLSLVVCARYLERIRHLSLRGCGITDIGLRELVRCRQLETLDLINCTKITPSGVQALIDSCTMLEEMNLPGEVISRKDLVCDNRRRPLTELYFI